MAWNDLMPVLSDDMVDEAEASMTASERTEWDDLFGVCDVINPQENRPHTLSLSLFYKPRNINDGEIPPLTEDILRSPRRYGVNTKYVPWCHYVEPILRHAHRICEAFPSVKVRVYLANDLSFLIPALSHSCEIYLMRRSSLRSAPGMLWRFLALQDGSLTTMLDADLMGFADARVRVTEGLPKAGVASWRIPIPVDYHKLCGTYYRPIAGFCWGTTKILPVASLLRAFWWHTMRGTMPIEAAHPLSGLRFRNFGSHWPDYGTDEFFMLTALFPRLASDGFLTVLPLLPRPPRSFFLQLDIEYVTSANSASWIDFRLFDCLYEGHVRTRAASGTKALRRSPNS